MFNLSIRSYTYIFCPEDQKQVNRKLHNPWIVRIWKKNAIHLLIIQIVIWRCQLVALISFSRFANLRSCFIATIHDEKKISTLDSHYVRNRKSIASISNRPVQFPYKTRAHCEMLNVTVAISRSQHDKGIPNDKNPLWLNFKRILRKKRETITMGYSFICPPFILYSRLGGISR